MRPLSFWEVAGQFAGGCLTFLFFFFIGALMSTIIGAFIGLIVGWFFADTILGILACIGITGFKMWEIGAFLGFVGSFFGGSFVKSQIAQTPQNAPQNQNERANQNNE